MCVLTDAFTACELYTPHSLPTATGKFYILSGQHRFQAARKLAAKLESEAKTVPLWAKTFSCTVVRKETSLETRQIIAGRVQATQGAVVDPTLSERLRWLLREVTEARAKDEPLNRTAVLRLTYVKTACREKVDGTMVCPCLHPRGASRCFHGRCMYA